MIPETEVQLQENSDLSLDLIYGLENDDSEPEEKLASVENAAEILTVNYNDANLQDKDLIKIYFKEIGKIPLLSKEEEIELAKLKEEGDEAGKRTKNLFKLLVYLRTFKNIRIIIYILCFYLVKLAEPEEQKKLAEIIEKGNKAKKKMVEANLRLVASVAKKYKNRGMQYIDLIQEGSIGLYRAVEKFDYRKGSKFASYGVYWIRQAIIRSIAYQANTIRVPLHTVEWLNKLNTSERYLTQNLGHKPDDEELAKEMGIQVDWVKSYKKVRHQKQQTSLSTPVKRFGSEGEDGDSLENFLVDDTIDSPQLTSVDADMKENIKKILSSLRPREEAVIRLRFGICEKNIH